jgi:fatty acid desaturase
VLGVVGTFLFAPLHESIHRTAFRSRWLNDTVARVAGFLLLLPPRYFRSFHLSHHRHTQVSARDPELVGKNVSTFGRYLIHVSGVLFWRDGILILIRHALGQVTAPFIGRTTSKSIINEARCYLCIYVLLAILSATFQTSVLVTFWLVPAILGQPILRLYLLAEHTLCPLIPDMLRNSRTTLTLLPVRFIAWNMPYHAEHHALMAIPFHALPRAHALFRDRIDHLTPGYSTFHGQVLAAIRQGNL